MSIESSRAMLSCSNVANVAKTVHEALAALDEGRLDIARTRLAEVLALVEEGGDATGVRDG